MYAIIETGGKQHLVKKGDVIDVEKINQENSNVEFKILFYRDEDNKTIVGTPHVENGIVKGEIISSVKGPKVFSYKYKKRKSYHKKIGHRQQYTKVKITDIQAG